MSSAARVINLQEAGWVAACRRGESDAFRPLIERYRQRVLTITMRMLGDRSEAYDMAQECFLKAYRSIDRYDPTRPFSSWLYRIAINTCLDRRRRKSRLVPLEIEPVARDTPDRALEESEMAEIVQLALNRLAPEYRAAVILKDIEGLAYEEMADILGDSVASLKTRVIRGRTKLATLLKKLHPDLLTERRLK